jgi:hypothetical protein
MSTVTMVVVVGRRRRRLPIELASAMMMDSKNDAAERMMRK